jgi:hypothetical protein
MMSRILLRGLAVGHRLPRPLLRRVLHRVLQRLRNIRHHSPAAVELEATMIRGGLGMNALRARLRGRRNLRTSDLLWARILFTASDLYAPPLHVVPARAARGAPGANLAALGGLSMQDTASELPRIPLPRTSVNKASRQCFGRVHSRFIAYCFSS